jgi:Fanconi anemia group M protein
MSNDLSRGLFPADQVKLLVVDEAHRAQGDYAYCQVLTIFIFKKKKFQIKIAHVCRQCGFSMNFN